MNAAAMDNLQGAALSNFPSMSDQFLRRQMIEQYLMMQRARSTPTFSEKIGDVWSTIIHNLKKNTYHIQEAILLTNLVLGTFLLFLVLLVLRRMFNDSRRNARHRGLAQTPFGPQGSSEDDLAKDKAENDEDSLTATIRPESGDGEQPESYWRRCFKERIQYLLLFHRKEIMFIAFINVVGAALLFVGVLYFLGTSGFARRPF
ncbi:unnamed protein product [Cyprideis torosa]|uniref:Uncharacterized protein n=2 Tax=Cyprideis torosa TaxID=163714 RepID=A0A7R8WGG7_9CRUS|nr:unnamed protein product [Cyprideis torosa]CAG0892099.1 unnamed protein product [Cyprideis torosa]